jgi:outer membrane immunogenic protein
MKKLLLAGVAFSALIAGPAMAADLARPVYRAPVAVPVPVSTWTGFYAGFNGGYGWSKASTTSTGFDTAGNGFPLIPSTAFDQNANGPVFGGTARKPG